MPDGMWDLSFLLRDHSCTPCTGSTEAQPLDHQGSPHYHYLWCADLYFRTAAGYVSMWASQVVLVVKNPPANSGDERDTGLIPGRQDPLEEGMVTHSSILAWKFPRTEEPGGLQSMGS